MQIIMKIQKRRKLFHSTPLPSTEPSSRPLHFGMLPQVNSNSNNDANVIYDTHSTTPMHSRHGRIVN